MGGGGRRLGPARSRLGAIPGARARAARVCHRSWTGSGSSHLSDFHFGVPSPGIGASWQAAAWARERKPDLVAISGDLLTHPRGEPMLRQLVRILPRPVFAVLGNHDIALSRDPQARSSHLQELEPATLLRDEGRLLELRGRTVWIAGADARLIARGRPGSTRTAPARSGRRPLDPAVPLPARARRARAGPLRPRAVRPHARRPDRAAAAGREVPLRAPPLRSTPASTATPPRRCTSPRGSARRSFRSASPRGPRRRSSCSDRR